MSARPSRRRGAAVIAGLAVLVLGGCVGIPTDGGVSTSVITANDDEESVIDLPEGPVAGAGPLEIIEGFVRAGRGPQDRYGVAREFLAADFAQLWNPIEQVRISGSAVRPVLIEDSRYRLSMAVSAQVDADGRYTEGASQQSFDFELVLEEGEWRISAAPSGTILPAPTFESVFGAYPLYFFDPTFDFLVPDLRWFPANSSAANRIVTELLDGPSPWLASGVLVSAFPAGTALLDGVAIANGRASVPLGPEIVEESQDTRRRMLQQLRASLSALGNVTSAEITDDGFPVSIPEGGSQPETNYQVGVNPLGLADGEFGELVDGEVVPVAGFGNRLDDQGLLAASVQRGRSAIAGLTDGGVVLFPASGDAVPLDTRPGLVAPTIDPTGFTWSVPAGDPRALVAFGRDAVARPVPLEIDGRIVSVDVSRDGARLLVALETPGGPRLLVTGIVRDREFNPVGLGVPIDLPVAGVLLDAAWVDAGSVVSLARRDGDVRITSFVLGGRSTDLGTLADAVAVVGGNNGTAGIRVLDSTGAVLRPSGSSGWTATGAKASFLATQH